MTRNNSDADATNNMKGEQLPLHLFLLLLLLLEKSLRTLLDKQNSSPTPTPIFFVGL